MAENARKQARVQLYIRGKGPVHEFSTELKGWEPNRLDVDEILKTYKLSAVFAMGGNGKRGLQIVPDARNGLSRTVYSGRESAIVRLDADPKEPLLSIVTLYIGGALLLVAMVMAMASRNPGWVEAFRQINETPGWPIGLTGTIVFVFLVSKGIKSWYR
eukprot:TRINITY_DN1272_c0_g1_i1.p1 TRINITY_DN1272_c0_g1~~TRINITY_DN1272_c0_g1_i1.p1  ORF type:complete len:159 (+),score=7.23 TRINITY_DN1272_c0_g1_i1:197-673(+)